MEIPGFDVKRTIGRGGMATVFLAIQQSLDREVVLKCLNTDHDESGDFFERFMLPLDPNSWVFRTWSHSRRAVCDKKTASPTQRLALLGLTLS